jgi:hypothetical protein|tara:strand:- start:1709 stop:1864 length:156 start_codon:yes stop_codon:yes gene_type:complete
MEINMFKKLWNIITGADANADGKVDIKDAFIKAEKKVKRKGKDKRYAPKEN